VVFIQHDINRTHIQIVSTTFDKEGIKISAVFDKKRSMEICRRIQNQNLFIPSDQKLSADAPFSFIPDLEQQQFEFNMKKKLKKQKL